MNNKIAQLTKERDEAYQRIEELENSANENFLSSTEYRRMQEEIHNLRLFEKLKIQHLQTEVKSNRKLMQEIKTIRDDNIELCKEHGIEYWEGYSAVIEKLEDVGKYF